MQQQFVKAPKLEYARSGANPTMKTQEYVLSILQKAEEPISRNGVLSILKAWGHSTTRPSLNVIVKFFADKGMIAEGSKGLVWVPQASDKLLETIRKA